MYISETTMDNVTLAAHYRQISYIDEVGWRSLLSGDNEGGTPMILEVRKERCETLQADFELTMQVLQCLQGFVAQVSELSSVTVFADLPCQATVTGSITHTCMYSFQVLAACSVRGVLLDSMQ